MQLEIFCIVIKKVILTTYKKRLFVGCNKKQKAFKEFCTESNGVHNTNSTKNGDCLVSF